MTSAQTMVFARRALAEEVATNLKKQAHSEALHGDLDPAARSHASFSGGRTSVLVCTSCWRAVSMFSR